MTGKATSFIFTLSTKQLHRRANAPKIDVFRQPVEMRHFLQATQREYRKMRKVLVADELVEGLKAQDNRQK